MLHAVVNKKNENNNSLTQLNLFCFFWLTIITTVSKTLLLQSEDMVHIHLPASVLNTYSDCPFESLGHCFLRYLLEEAPASFSIKTTIFCTLI